MKSTKISLADICSVVAFELLGEFSVRWREKIEMCWSVSNGFLHAQASCCSDVKWVKANVQGKDYLVIKDGILNYCNKGENSW